MEIIVELIVQFLVEVIWEVLLQGVFQVIFDSLLLSGRAAFGPLREFSAWFFGIGYLLLGVLAGFISLIFFPALFVKTIAFQIANLLLTPLICGAMMSLIGSWRESRGWTRMRMETFAYGVLFSLAFSVTRFLGAAA